MRKDSLSRWLKGRCEKERLSLRQAAAKTGLSHATIRDIIKGGSASAESIRKLAQGFSNGINERLTLEDYLLVLAGYRTPRPEGEKTSEPLAQLMDKVKQFDESQLKMMGYFADFLIEIDGRSSEKEQSPTE